MTGKELSALLWLTLTGQPIGPRWKPVETVPCPCCEDGTVYGFRDRWDEWREQHYTEDDNNPCDVCRGEGALGSEDIDSVSGSTWVDAAGAFDIRDEASRDHWLAAEGYKLDDTGLWRKV